MNSSTKLFLLHATILLVATTTRTMSEESLKKFTTPLPTCHSEVENLVDISHELTLYDGDFSPLPNDVLSLLLISPGCDLPWDEFVRIIKLRTVCKRWLSILADNNNIAACLQIPPMHLAAMMGDVDKIIDLKFAGHPLLEPDCHGYRPAHYAAASKMADNEKYRTMRLLKIGHGLDIDLEPKEKLIQLLANNDTQCMSLFGPINTEYDARRGAEIINREMVMLKEIISHFNLEKLEDTLLKLKNKLMFIQYCDNPFGIEYFLPSHGQDLDETQKKIAQAIALRIKYMMASVHEEMLRRTIMNNGKLIDYFFCAFSQFSADPNACNDLGSPFLFQQVSKGKWHYERDDEILSGLLSYSGIDVNLPTKYKARATPLVAAVCRNNTKAIKVLLEYKNEQGIATLDVNKPDTTGYTPLHFAVDTNNVEQIILLLEYGADVNYRSKEEGGGATPVHLAAMRGYDTILKVLLDTRKCNLEILDYVYNATPLQRALYNNRSSCVRLLLERGAMTHYKNWRDEPLLIQAARYGAFGCVKELLVYMSNQVHCSSQGGCTLLHCTAIAGNAEHIDLLIKYGIPINGKTPDEYAHKGLYLGGFTPLHLALYYKRLAVIQELVRLGADVTLTTAAGKTMLDLANESGDEEIIAYINKILQCRATQSSVSVIGDEDDEKK